MLDNAVHKRLYYVHNEKPRRHYDKDTKRQRTTGLGLSNCTSPIHTPYTIKGDCIMTRVYNPHPYQIKDNECNNLNSAKSYVSKFEKHVLEWEHDDYTQVEINDIIEEFTC